jgi:hypothetical protein
MADSRSHLSCCPVRIYEFIGPGEVIAGVPEPVQHLMQPTPVSRRFLIPDLLMASPPADTVHSTMEYNESLHGVSAWHTPHRIIKNVLSYALIIMRITVIQRL